ncbi:hypothetical protein [Roseovarius arcticus]|uniref:hypothetical protein n=1 Tax=Roseovarius arcticus TaxID=2547404 RepID=UPI0014875525|nr:hypothetical protein [Roseovarius arcticus]
MAYIESPEWESRLKDARIKRQVVLAARANTEALQRRDKPEEIKTRAPKLDNITFKSQPQTGSPEENALKPNFVLKGAPKIKISRRSPHPLMRPLLGALAGFGLFGILTVGSLLLLQPSHVGGEITVNEDTAGQARSTNSASPGQRDDLFGTVTHQSSSGDLAGAKQTYQPVSFDILASALKEFSNDYQITIVTNANRANSIAQLNYADGPAVKVRTTTFETPRPVVAYFHAADTAAAVRFSTRIEGEAMDLQGMLPSPPTGTLEVFLAGS